MAGGFLQWPLLQYKSIRGGMWSDQRVSKSGKQAAFDLTEMSAALTLSMSLMGFAPSASILLSARLQARQKTSQRTQRHASDRQQCVSPKMKQCMRTPTTQTPQPSVPTPSTSSSVLFNPDAKGWCAEAGEVHLSETVLRKNFITAATRAASTLFRSLPRRLILVSSGLMQSLSVVKHASLVAGFLTRPW